MKRTIALFACFSALFSVFAFGCGKTVGVKTAEVNRAIPLSEFYTDKDAFYNTAINGENKAEINGTSVTFTKIGKYQLVHADGKITEIRVKDTVAPEIYMDASGFFPQTGKSTPIPVITVVDGYDGEIADYTVKVDGVSASSVTFEDYGVKTLTVTATDKSGNLAVKDFPLECLPLRDVKVQVGEKIVLGKDFFYGLDEDESYQYSFTVVKVKGLTVKTLVAVTEFTVENGCYYEVTGEAVTRTGDRVKGYKLFYESGLSLLTFNPVGNGNYSSSELDLYTVYQVFEDDRGRQFSTLPAVSRTITRENGNGVLSLSSADGNIWAWRLALKGVTGGGKMYFDVRFEKEEFDADGNPEWIIEIVKDTKILKYEHAGRYCVEMEEGQGDVSYRFGVNGPKLTANAVYLDNIIFVPN